MFRTDKPGNQRSGTQLKNVLDVDGSGMKSFHDSKASFSNLVIIWLIKRRLPKQAINLMAILSQKLP